MAMIVLIIHLIVCIALIGLVLLQRSEGGALGIGGSGGALMSGRGAADALAKMTTFAGGFFLITSLSLTVISGAARDATGGSVFDRLPSFNSPATPAPDAVTPAEEQPTAPDPTQSSAPQAATTQLAAAEPANAQPTVILGPATAAAGERAGPLNAATPATTPRSTPTATRTASTQQPATTRPASTAPTTVQRNSSAGGTTQPAATTAPVRTTPLRLPGGDQAAAALNTVPLDAAGDPESPQGDGVAAVRRERAGPDQ